MQFWFSMLVKREPSQPIFPKIETHFSLYTDASDLGAGGYIEGIAGSEYFYEWNESERTQSSTHRELRAILPFIRNFLPMLRNKSIHWFTDNANAASIVQNGSMNSELQEIAMQIRNLSNPYNIRIVPSWVRRKDNAYADLLSRNTKEDEWAINSNVFSLFDRKWGPHTFDRFASSSNTKCAKFNSRNHCGYSQGADSLKVSWSHELNWLVPPVGLIGRVVEHLEGCRANGTLVVPRWQSAYFWPLLCKEDGSFKSYIEDYVEYKHPNNFFVSYNSKVFNNSIRPSVICLKIRFHQLGVK